jgi:hypothetical protein
VVVNLLVAVSVTPIPTKLSQPAPESVTCCVNAVLVHDVVVYSKM